MFLNHCSVQLALVRFPLEFHQPSSISCHPNARTSKIYTCSDTSGLKRWRPGSIPESGSNKSTKFCAGVANSSGSQRRVSHSTHNWEVNYVANSDRLRPEIRNSAEQRVDTKLPFGTYDENVQRIRNMSLCSWHYLRSDHNVNNCKRSHEYLRPLSNHDYDALC